MPYSSFARGTTTLLLAKVRATIDSNSMVVEDLVYPIWRFTTPIVIGNYLAPQTYASVNNVTEETQYAQPCRNTMILHGALLEYGTGTLVFSCRNPSAAFQEVEGVEVVNATGLLRDKMVVVSDDLSHWVLLDYHPNNSELVHIRLPAGSITRVEGSFRVQSTTKDTGEVLLLARKRVYLNTFNGVVVFCLDTDELLGIVDIPALGRLEDVLASEDTDAPKGDRFLHCNRTDSEGGNSDVVLRLYNSGDGTTHEAGFSGAVLSASLIPRTSIAVVNGTIPDQYFSFTIVDMEHEEVLYTWIPSCLSSLVKFSVNDSQQLVLLCRMPRDGESDEIGSVCIQLCEPLLQECELC